MRQNSVLYSLFCMVFLFSLNNLSASPISLIKLTNSEWRTDEEIRSIFFSFTFQKSGKVVIVFNGYEEGGEFTGFYKIEPEKITITDITPTRDNYSQGVFNEKVLCTLQNLTNSLISNEILTCIGAHIPIKLLNYKKLVTPGSVRQIGKQKSIIFSKKMKTNTNLVIRTEPSISAPKVTFFLQDEKSAEKKQMQSLPKNTTVMVMTLTPEKLKVNQWKNYWYYIRFETITDGSAYALLNKHGWVFGEFLE